MYWNELLTNLYELVILISGSNQSETKGHILRDSIKVRVTKGNTIFAIKTK